LLSMYLIIFLLVFFSFIFKLKIVLLFSGKLHRPPEICPQRFSEELLFWRLTRVEVFNFIF
jgi:hypothetical protein